MPSLLDNEVASALRVHALGDKLGTEQLEDAAQDFSDLDIERYPLSMMIRDVLAVRDNFTVSDAAYVVLAQALDLPVVTADQKMTEARRLGVEVRVFRPSP